MWNKMLGSINELPVERKSTKISDVARGGNFGFLFLTTDSKETVLTVGLSL